MKITRRHILTSLLLPFVPKVERKPRWEDFIAPDHVPHLMGKFYRSRVIAWPPILMDANGFITLPHNLLPTLKS